MEANDAALNLLGKWEALYQTRAFANGDKLIRAQCPVILCRAGRPVNLNARGALNSQSKMQSGVVCREIARLAHHLLRLNVFAIPNQHPCANCTSIAFGSLESNLDPVVPGRRVIPQ
jgi:hypothetical protein